MNSAQDWDEATREQRAEYRDQFLPGRKFRVIKPVRVSGMKTIAPWTRQGYREEFAPGAILVCGGESRTSGDGVRALKWAYENGMPICEDATIDPHVGSMWEGIPPEPGYLEPVEP